MRRTLWIVYFVALGMGCGEGQWGAEVHLSMGATDEAGDALSSGTTVELADGAWTLTLDQACLSVELALITPAASESEGGADCFCHGDPPECHGDCGTTTTVASADLSQELDAVVDLLGDDAELAERGGAPGDYSQLTLVLGGEHADVIPAACADAEGSTLYLLGSLQETATGRTWTLTVDLRDEVVTEPLTLAPAAHATTEEPAHLHANLRLDLALAGVDFAAVTADASGAVTIGYGGDHPEAEHEIIHGLTHAESYVAMGH